MHLLTSDLQVYDRDTVNGERYHPLRSGFRSQHACNSALNRHCWVGTLSVSQSVLTASSLLTLLRKFMYIG